MNGTVKLNSSILAIQLVNCFEQYLHKALQAA